LLMKPGHIGRLAERPVSSLKRVILTLKARNNSTSKSACYHV
jgi:hypothetical protein